MGPILLADFHKLKELPAQLELEVTEKALLLARDEKRTEDMAALKDKIVDMRQASCNMRARDMIAELVVLKSRLDNRYLELVNDEDDIGCAVIQDYIEQVKELNKLERPKGEKQMRLKVKVPKPIPEVKVVAKATAVGVRVNSHIDSGDEKEDRAQGVRQRIEKFNGLKQTNSNETTLDMLKQKADRLSSERAALNASVDKFNNSSNRFKSSHGIANPTPIITPPPPHSNYSSTTTTTTSVTAAAVAAIIDSGTASPARSHSYPQTPSQVRTQARTQSLLSYPRSDETFESIHEEVKEDPRYLIAVAVDKAEDKDKLMGDVLMTMAADEKSNEMKDMGVKQRIEKFNAMKASAAAASARMGSSDIKSNASANAGSKSPNISSDGSKLLEVRSRFDKFSDPKSPSGHFIVEKLSGEKLHLIKEDETF